MSGQIQYRICNVRLFVCVCVCFRFLKTSYSPHSHSKFIFSQFPGLSTVIAHCFYGFKKLPFFFGAGKASLRGKNVFASTVVKICSSALLQVCWYGHTFSKGIMTKKLKVFCQKSCTKSMPVLANLLKANEQILWKSVFYVETRLPRPMDLLPW